MRRSPLRIEAESPIYRRHRRDRIIEWAAARPTAVRGGVRHGGDALGERTNRRRDPRRQPDRARAPRSPSAFPAKATSPCSTRCTTSRDRLRLIVCRQEGGAAYMAEAYGKLTGRPGIAFVTRGPGASNAAIGIHTAAQDSTPMIVFVGQVGGDFVDREAFQEIDYRRMYGSVAKWAAQIDRAERIPEYVARAYRVAMSGRPGPGGARAARGHAGRARDVRGCAARRCRSRAAPDARADRGRARAAARARSGRWCSSAAAAGTPPRAPRCGDSPKPTRCPVACAFRHQDLFDNRHPQLCGRRRHRHQPAARGARARGRRAARHRRAAGRDDDVAATRCSTCRAPKQRLIHVHPDAGRAGPRLPAGARHRRRRRARSSPR